MTARPRFLATLIALCLALPLPARAMTTTEAVFDVYFAGIRAGVVVFKGHVGNGQYSVAGQMKSTGLLAAVRNLRFDVRAHGAMRGDRFIPLSYSEKNDNGRRKTDASIEFVNGVPQLKRYNPPEEPGPYALDPATQAGTLDPATAVFATLRDRPRSETCNSRVDTFDGKRRSRISLGRPNVQGDTISCNGEYRRIAGYAPWEMEERVTFPFSVTFRPNGDGLMEVGDVRVQTYYGTASMLRR